MNGPAQTGPLAIHMKIVFDLDYTLMDTARFKEALAEAVTAHGVSRERYEETYKAIVKREGKVYDYDPDVHIEALGGDFSDAGAAAEARRSIDKVVAESDKYLFPGSVELLKELRREGRELVLLTLGNEGWQRRKVENSGLHGYFDEVIATGKHKTGEITKLAESREKTIIVNDNGEEIKEMMRQAPRFTYIMKKGPKPIPKELIEMPSAEDILELEELLVAEGALDEAFLEKQRELHSETDEGAGAETDREAGPEKDQETDGRRRL
jgi:FMN phosphatase YigB (HAD superfamily)